MHDQQLNMANIKNLSRLWQQMGARSCTLDGMDKFQISDSWPNRCWFEAGFSVDEITTIGRSIHLMADKLVIPVWDMAGTSKNLFESMLKNNGFTIISEQMAMSLDLNKHPIMPQYELDIIRIEAEQDINIWTNIASKSFQYEIDISIPKKIVVHPDVKLYMAYINDKPVATAMIFDTDDVTGVHQIGVLPEYRGHGVASKLMHNIINLCTQKSSRYITLQASTAGEYLYHKLGFKRQFKILNYQKFNR